MDIFKQIKQDHDKQRDLAAKLIKTQGDSEERRDLWEQFKPEVTAHANAEEQTFYAALIQHSNAQEQARHSISEHKETDDLIQELDDTEFSSSGWLKKFEKLKDELEHHMQEEEQDVFELAQKTLNQNALNDIAESFAECKREELGEAMMS